MTTFKSQRSDKTIKIRASLSQTGIVICWDGGSINLDPADAPAIALAVLEAAGIDAGKKHEDWLSCVEHAQRLLAEHIGIERNKAAAAAEEAELEREAKELYYASQGPDEAYQLWLHLGEGERGKWGRAARRARELAKERAKQA